MKRPFERYQSKYARVACLLLLGLLPISCTSNIIENRETDKQSPDKEIVLSSLPAISEESAQQKLSSGNYEGAITDLSIIIAKDQNNYRAHLSLADILLRLKRSEDSRVHYNLLLQHDQYRTEALRGLGYVDLLQGNLEAAKEKLLQVVEDDPESWKAWMGLGRIYDDERNWTLSEDAYQKALSLSPRNTAVLNNLGLSHFMQGNMSKSKNYFMEANKIAPVDPTISANLRNVLAWEGKYPEALSNVSPEELPVALNNAGYVAMLRGDYREAEALLSRAKDASLSYYKKAHANLAYVKSLE